LNQIIGSYITLANSNVLHLAPELDSPKTFHSAIVQLRSNDDCNSRRFKMTRGMFCGESHNGARLGSGDAGGGLICDLKGVFQCSNAMALRQTF